MPGAKTTLTGHTCKPGRDGWRRSLTDLQTINQLVIRQETKVTPPIILHPRISVYCELAINVELRFSLLSVNSTYLYQYSQYNYGSLILHGFLFRNEVDIENSVQKCYLGTCARSDRLGM